jgi:hypothetical protein
VFLSVVFSGFFRMVGGMKVVAMRYMSVVAGFFMIASFMVFCRF